MISAYFRYSPVQAGLLELPNSVAQIPRKGQTPNDELETTVTPEKRSLITDSFQQSSINFHRVALGSICFSKQQNIQQSSARI